MDLYEHGKFQQAAEMLSKASSSSADRDIHLWLGKADLKLRKWDDAVREMEQAAQVSPSNGTYHLWLGKAYGRKASHVSFVSASGWARKVGRELEKAVKLSPRNLEARFDLLRFYLKAPGMLGGGKDKAEAEAKEIAAIDPRQGYTARARIFEQGEQWDQARQELTKATTEFPKDAGAFIDLADFLLGRGNYAAAEANARTALALDPGNVKATYLRAAATIGLRKDIPAAERSLTALSTGRLRDSDPGLEEIYYWLGRAYQARGKTSEARQAYQTALRFDPENGTAKSALSRIQ